MESLKELKEKYDGKPGVELLMYVDEIGAMISEWMFEGQQAAGYYPNLTWKPTHIATWVNHVCNNRFGYPSVYREGYEIKPLCTTQIERPYVDLVSAGYEWVCPECNRRNNEIEATEQVTCSRCYGQFNTNPPEHVNG